MSVVKTKQVKSSQVKPTLAETERGTNATKEKRFGGEREGERPAVCVCVCVRALVSMCPRYVNHQMVPVLFFQPKSKTLLFHHLPRRHRQADRQTYERFFAAAVAADGLLDGSTRLMRFCVADVMCFLVLSCVDVLIAQWIILIGIG